MSILILVFMTTHGLSIEGTGLSDTLLIWFIGAAHKVGNIINHYILIDNGQIIVRTIV